MIIFELIEYRQPVTSGFPGEIITHGLFMYKKDAVERRDELPKGHSYDIRKREVYDNGR